MGDFYTDQSCLRPYCGQCRAGVSVLNWTDTLDLAAAGLVAAPCEVLVEAFGCEIPPAFLAACAASPAVPPLWINLEYLTAEAYAERSHALPSPVSSGPGKGWTKWFFYPGFSAASGGLLREPDLATRQAVFEPATWLAARGIENAGEALVSLFCYEPPALARLLSGFAAHGLEGRPVRLLVAAGRPARAVQAQQIPDGLLSVTYLPLLNQDDFDRLLWACELNFVRGEDSLVRAIWAGKPFVWQIYPQDDNAHRDKLEAFLEMMAAPPSWRDFHRAWNSSAPPAPGSPDLGPALPEWQKTALAANQRLTALPDLSSSLLGFVQKNR
jgi:uncharacterized repeat protein (TIGR03837 family)